MVADFNTRVQNFLDRSRRSDGRWIDSTWNTLNSTDLWNMGASSIVGQLTGTDLAYLIPKSFVPQDIADKPTLAERQDAIQAVDDNFILRTSTGYNPVTENVNDRISGAIADRFQPVQFIPADPNGLYVDIDTYNAQPEAFQVPTNSNVLTRNLNTDNNISQWVLGLIAVFALKGGK